MLLQLLQLLLYDNPDVLASSPAPVLSRPSVSAPAVTASFSPVGASVPAPAVTAAVSQLLELLFLLQLLQLLFLITAVVAFVPVTAVVAFVPVTAVVAFALVTAVVAFVPDAAFPAV